LIDKKSVKVKSRKESFAPRAQTCIWQEIAEEGDEYAASKAYCFGYSQETLLEKGYGITDMAFLLARGELPTASQRKILDALGVALANPGPRHPATRAAMEAGVSRTRSQHLLPISLMILGGDHAAGGVEAAMRFLRLNQKKPVYEIVAGLLESYTGPEGDKEIAPGYGPHYEVRETLAGNLARVIKRKFSDTGLELKYLDWSLEMDELLSETSCAIRMTGLAAALFLDLGFHPRFGPPLYQYLAAPGLLAHGLEMSNKPITAMPFVGDEDYHHVNEMENDS